MNAPSECILPVRPHVRSRPRHNPRNKVPKDMRAKLPLPFTEAVGNVLVFEPDPCSHPCGWSSDCVGVIPIWEADALETWGCA